MVIDTGASRADVTATRREIALQKQIIESTVPIVDRYGSALDALQVQLRKDLITIEQHNEVNRQLKAEFPQNIAAEQSYTAALHEGEAARRSLMTATDQMAESEKRLAEAKRGVVQLQNDGIITDDEAGRRLTALRANAPGVIQAERDRGDAIARGRALTEQWLPVSMRASRELAEVRAHHIANRVPIEAYRNAQIQLTAAQLTGIPIIGRFAGVVAGINPVLLPVVAGVAGWVAILKVAHVALDFATEKIAEQYAEMDKLVNSAEKLSVPVGQFQAMAHAADRADMTVDEFSKGYETMLGNLSKAAAGKPKALEAFNLIEVDAKRLKNEKPEEILRQVVSGLDGVGDASDRLRAAQSIFGDTEFLRLNLVDLIRANQILDDTRGRLTDLDKANLGELNKATKDLQFTFDSIWKRVAADLAPALAEAANAATDLLLDASKNQTFVDTMRQATDATHGLVLSAKELPSSLVGWGTAIESTSPKLMLLSTLADKISGAFAEIGQENRLVGEAAQRMSESGLEKALGSKLDDSSRGALGFVEKERAKAVEELSKEMEKLLDNLRDEAEYAGYAKEEIILLKLAEQGASQAVRDLAHSQASIALETQREKKHAEAVKQLSDSIEDQSAKLRLSGHAYEEWKLARANVEPELRAQLLATYDSGEAAKTQAEGVKKAEQAAKSHADSLKTLTDNLEKQRIKFGQSERAAFDYELTMHGMARADRETQLAKFDQMEQFKKEDAARKKGIETIKELEKSLRQVGLTESGKKLDDAKAAGITDKAQLQVIEKLQKELELRGNIHKQITASSGVIKAGSREAADAIAAAQRAALRQHMDDPTSRLVSAPIPKVRPFMDRIVGASVMDRTDMPMDAESPFAEAYRMMGKTDPVADRRREWNPIDMLMKSWKAPVDAAQWARPPQQMIIPRQDQEQINLQKQTVAVLNRIEQKTGPIEVEEVTL